MTVLQKLTDSVTQLTAELKLESNNSLATAAQRRQVVELATKVDALEPEVSKLSRRAAETDPNRKTYGPSMIAKVIHSSSKTIRSFTYHYHTPR